MNEYEVECWHSGDDEEHVYAVVAETVPAAINKTLHYLWLHSVDPSTITYIRVLTGLDRSPEITIR